MMLIFLINTCLRSLPDFSGDFLLIFGEGFVEFVVFKNS